MKSVQQSPTILVQGAYTRDDLIGLKARNIWRTVDILERQLIDLFEIENPPLASAPTFAQQAARFARTQMGDDPDLYGDWTYFPWNGVLLHSRTETRR